MVEIEIGHSRWNYLRLRMKSVANMSGAVKRWRKYKGDLLLKSIRNEAKHRRRRELV
jgi:hypothetical protein